MTTHVLYNPHAGNDHGKEEAEKLNSILKDSELVYHDMTAVTSYSDMFAMVGSDDTLVICGGDGTLNRFVNETAGLELPASVLYYATGSGNDFLHDLGLSKGGEPIAIKEYIENLPTVTVKGKEYRFINGVGYGIDGYCCEVADKIRDKEGDHSKPINYTAIAIKGLLFHYKPTSATVTVDGVKHTYTHVWLAPTMNGRFYGGGMMPTPEQDRKNTDGKLSVLVFHRSSKLKTLMVFPSIFKGEHIKHTDITEVLTGNEITVEFDSPTALQIDGETILGVTSYTARGKVTAKV